MKISALATLLFAANAATTHATETKQHVRKAQDDVAEKVREDIFVFDLLLCILCYILCFISFISSIISLLTSMLYIYLGLLIINIGKLGYWGFLG